MQYSPFRIIKPLVMTLIFAGNSVSLHVRTIPVLAEES
jgi:hypothetical protein